MNPLEVRPDNIWHYKQNRPSLIAKDLEAFGVPQNISMRILMARGVCKWLAVRRDIIRLKDKWKSQISSLEQNIRNLKRPGKAYDLGYARGYLKALKENRAALRALCHGPRWQMPDIDMKSWKILWEGIDDDGSDD